MAMATVPGVGPVLEGRRMAKEQFGELVGRAVIARVAVHICTSSAPPALPSHVKQ